MNTVKKNNLKIFSKKIKKIPHISEFLPEWDIYSNSSFQGVAGWGARPSTHKARKYAQINNLPFISLEDGFLRSLGLGVDNYPPFSLIYDDIGVYYDTTRTSKLEKIILSINKSEYSNKLIKAQNAIDLICKYELSKYNHANDFISSYTERNIVLVLDQTYGDMSVKYGQADEKTFKNMLTSAIVENPNATILIKTHPDVLRGKKKGYLTDISLFSDYSDQISILADDINPLSLLKYVDKVYCVTSQMGFEALLLGKKVITFGVPWFSGWGVTEDRHENIHLLFNKNRRQKRTVLQLFCASYLIYSRYINPHTGKAGTIFDVIYYLNKVKNINKKLSGNLYCIGMSLWKRMVIKPFFNLPSCQLHFIKSFEHFKRLHLKHNAKLLIWNQGNNEIVKFAEKNNLPILRIEDGFLRSVGLGSNLVSPISIVVDDLGIYFNHKKISRLENILQTTNFSDEDIAQAKWLQAKLIKSHLGKYNVGSLNYKLNPQIKKVILVPGQVEDDASILLSSPTIKTNLELLKQVRKLNPDSYILYKPHPDVVSGNRRGNIDNAMLSKYADEVVENVNILDCITQVDEVHTMTSLAGFEALLRGKIVHCYGVPFYSNWGLTIDYIKENRRTRQLTIYELISGTLVYYPLYILPNSKVFTDVEYAISFLEKERNSLKDNGLYRSWIIKQIVKLKQIYTLYNFDKHN